MFFFIKKMSDFWKFWDCEFGNKVSIFMLLVHARCLFGSQEVELQSQFVKCSVGNFLSGFGFGWLRNEKEVTDNYYQVLVNLVCIEFYFIFLAADVLVDYLNGTS